MKTLSPAELVQMFLDAGELDGLTSLFEATFPGRLLHDEGTGQFIHMTDEEFDKAQHDAAEAAQSVMRQRCHACPD